MTVGFRPIGEALNSRSLTPRRMTLSLPQEEKTLENTGDRAFFRGRQGEKTGDRAFFRGRQGGPVGSIAGFSLSAAEKLASRFSICPFSPPNRTKLVSK